MTLQFKKTNQVPNQVPNQTPAQQQPTVQGPQIVSIKPPGSPYGAAIGTPTVNLAIPSRVSKPIPPPQVPGQGLERALNYYADYGGCGFWRMVWPEMLMNGFQKGIINGLTTMVLDPRFYHGIRAVRLQRQATPVQLEFVKFLKQGAEQHNFKIIYEIDDVIFKDDIPDYNRCKVAFEDDTIVHSVLEMMKLSDEISVTCQYMKDYYQAKTGNKNITIIPNYPPRLWADGYYDEKKILKNYNTFKKKPRIGYCGSGTHIDVTNKTNQKDDFEHVVQAIIKSRHDFHWIFFGCFPLPLKPFIDRGEMEYVKWANIIDYPRAMSELNLNAVFAPLQDNTFNRSKSNIKYLEPSCIGVPGVFQDIVTYQDAPLRFTTGDELVDQLKKLLKTPDTYVKYSKQARQYAETMWLDNHIEEYRELYYTDYNAKVRKALLGRNPEQG